MSTPTISQSSQVSSYVALMPLMASLKTSFNTLMKSVFPIDTEGPIISNQLHSVKSPTIYNSHGIVTPDNPNSLIAYV